MHFLGDKVKKFLTFLIRCQFITVIFITGCATPKVPEGAILSPQLNLQEQVEQIAYRLQVGDQLEFKFFYHPELNEHATIRPDGRITLQLVGELMAEGQTANQLDKTLTSMYKKHIKDPEVAVLVRHMNASRVYVGGQVSAPRVLTIHGRLTGLQAIMEAGGFLASSENRMVIILRNQGKSKPLFIVANMQKHVSIPGDANDIELQHGDIVFVPRSEISKVNLAVEQYVDKLLPFKRVFSADYAINK